MPALTNPRRELFAQLLFQGFTKSEAYLKAGFKGHSGNASTLSRNPEIADRVAELRAEAEAALVPVGTAAIAARAKVTAESLIDEAEQVRVGAMESKQYGHANGAIREKGVLSGVRVERAEIGAPGEFEALSDDELEVAVVEQFRSLGYDVMRKLTEESITVNGKALVSQSDDD